MKLKYLGTAIIAALLMCGCNSGNKAADNHSESEEHKEGASEHGDEIVLTEAQLKEMEVKTEAARRGAMQGVLKTGGCIESPQGSEQTISATASGIIHFTGGSLTEGVAVKGGQSIAGITSRDLQNGDPAVKARIDLETARSAYERAQRLIGDKIISQREYELLRQDYERAKATYSALMNNRGSGGSVSVTVPHSGYVRQVLVSDGQYVAEGQAIAVIGENSRLWLVAQVPENKWSEIDRIKDAKFKTSYTDIATLSELGGKICSRGKSSADETPYLRVVFEFTNPGNGIYAPGSYAEVYLLSDSETNTLSVPLSALTEEQGLYYVYVANDDEPGSFTKREVSIGISDGERVEILAGLQEGENVVSHGTYNVKLASLNAEIPHGHSH